MTTKRMLRKSLQKRSTNTDRDRIIAHVLKPFTSALFEKFKSLQGKKGLDIGYGMADSEVLLENITVVDSTTLAMKADRGPIYDFAFMRFPNLDNTELHSMLKAAFDVIKPGGMILIEKIDFAHYHCTPYSYALQRFLELSMEINRIKCISHVSSYSLKKILTNTGYTEVGIQALPPVFLYDEYKKIGSISLEGLSNDIIKERLAKPQELQALVAALSSFEQKTDSMISLGGLFQAWGRKPI